jgi:YHS domain-containing protein
MIAIDPVCKMEVEIETAEWTSEYRGETYYFCAPGCKRSFDQDPEKYLSGQGSEGHHEHHH